jgi:hypothetical protein
MTAKQLMAAKLTLDNQGNVSKAMKQAGYSPAMVKNPQSLTRSKGWQEAMEQAGITPGRLMKKLNKGLDAKKTITSLSGDIISREEDYAIQHKYLDTALKVAGAYQNTEGGSLHFHQHITGNKGKYGL